MKNLFKNKKFIITASILIVVGIGLPFGIFFFSRIPQLNMLTLNYNIFLWIFAFIYLLVGFVWGDVVVARWRKTNQEWDTKLPENIKTNVWKIRMTFYIPALVVFVVAIFFDVFALIAGFYPFF